MANVPAQLVNNPFPSWLVSELESEIVRQDQKWGPIEGASTAGAVRLGLALIADELEEARYAWRAERYDAPRERRSPTHWSDTHREVLQVAAVALRTLRDAL